MLKLFKHLLFKRRNKQTAKLCHPGRVAFPDVALFHMTQGAQGAGLSLKMLASAPDVPACPEQRMSQEGLS